MDSYENFFDDLLRTYEGNALYMPDPEEFGLFVDDPFEADINLPTETPAIESTSPPVPTIDDVPDLVHDYVCESCSVKNSQPVPVDMTTSERIQSMEEKLEALKYHTEAIERFIHNLVPYLQRVTAIIVDLVSWRWTQISAA